MADARHAPAEKSRKPGKTDENRMRLYRAVRAACKRLGIDDDDRRALQLDLTGKRSMSDMTLAEIGRLLDRLNRDRAAPMGHRAHVGKIKALWWTLYWLGEVARPDDDAISAFVQRQTGIGALRFLDHRQAPSVIEALKSWAARCGVVWPTAEATEEACANSPHLTPAQHDRVAVLSAIGERLYRLGAMEDWQAHLCRILGTSGNPLAWTATELDSGIRHLGRALRKLEG